MSYRYLLKDIYRIFMIYEMNIASIIVNDICRKIFDA
jgi:hypothetical protein